MIVRSPRAIEFACHSAACAPPPAGKGGSSRSGSPVRANPVGPGAGRNPNQRMITRTIRAAEGRGGPTVSKNRAPIKGSDLKPGDRIIFGQQAKTVSSIHPMKNGRVGVTFKTGGITDVSATQTFPRPNLVKPRGYKQGTNKFSPGAHSPNNPRNHQRHPDDDGPDTRFRRK